MSPALPDHVDLIVTHGGCHDGFTAEWLLHHRWPEAPTHQAAYQEDIEPLIAKGVDAANYRRQIARHGEVPQSIMVMADFSYGPAEMTALAEAWGRIILLDHHATAINRLDGNLPANVECVFDVNRSGAGIVADWLGTIDARHADFWPGDGTVRQQAPLVNYVEDRDLWRHVGANALPDSLPISAVIGATEHTYDAWSNLNRRIGGDYTARLRVIEDGELLLAYRQVLIDELVGKARPVIIDGHEALLTASPYNLGSDVAGELARRSPSGIGMHYQDLPDRIEYGLRSTDDGPNVAKIAERFGGGGHPHASGFRRERDAGWTEVFGAPVYK